MLRVTLKSGPSQPVPATTERYRLYRAILLYREPLTSRDGRPLHRAYVYYIRIRPYTRRVLLLLASLVRIMSTLYRVFYCGLYKTVSPSEPLSNNTGPSCWLKNKSNFPRCARSRRVRIIIRTRARERERDPVRGKEWEREWEEGKKKRNFYNHS